MPEVVVKTTGVDEEGTSYNQYPHCPMCSNGGRVGRSAFARGEYARTQEAKGYPVAPWYCYACGHTFH